MSRSPTVADLPPRVDVPGTAVRYRVIHGYRRAFRMMGSGPALLLLHGIGDNSEAWVPLMPILAEHYTVIAPDLLGHGRSDKPRADYSVAGFANGMRDLCEVLGIDRVTVVGHSLGGGVAAQFAYQYPERCERLVLVATGGVAGEVTPILRVAAAPLADVVLPALRLPITRIAGAVVLDVLRRLNNDLGLEADEVMRIYNGLPDGPARGAFTRTLRAAVDWRGQSITLLDRCYLADSVPVLLVWGDRDAIIPVAHAHQAHAAMPGSRLEIFAGAGHFPHHADPDRFATLLGDFLRSTSPAVYDKALWRKRLRRGNPRHPAAAEHADDRVEVI